jgi:excisionase family DNA binding protein
VSPAPPVTFPSLDALEADVALAETLPVAVLAERARKAARLAADLQAALLGRAASRDSGSPEPDRLLAIPKIAQILEFTEQYVYELIRRGHLPAVRSGKYVRVSASALDSFIKNGPLNVLDGALSRTYRTRREPAPAASAQTPRSKDPDRTPRQARRRPEQERSVRPEQRSNQDADARVDRHDIGVIDADAEGNLNGLHP